MLWDIIDLFSLMALMTCLFCLLLDADCFCAAVVGLWCKADREMVREDIGDIALKDAHKRGESGDR